MKVVAPVQVRLNAVYPGCDMPKNATDARRAIAFACVRIRAHRDNAEVEESLRKYAVDRSTKVFLSAAGNIEEGLEFFSKNYCPGRSDALRLAGIMCDR
jgi:hypothetical protein